MFIKSDQPNQLGNFSHMDFPIRKEVGKISQTLHGYLYNLHSEVQILFQRYHQLQAKILQHGNFDFPLILCFWIQWLVLSHAFTCIFDSLLGLHKTTYFHNIYCKFTHYVQLTHTHIYIQALAHLGLSVNQQITIVCVTTYIYNYIYMYLSMYISID